VKKVLVIAAHPDDEVLGCGGTIARHINEGDEVSVIFMADGVAARDGSLFEKDLHVRYIAASNACKILGVKQTFSLGFPDNRMDTIALLDIVKNVEKVINEIQPRIIYTHHAGDLNIDHQITHQAVMTACRPQPGFCVKEIFNFEVLSSTEWSTPSVNNIFAPSLYVDISSTFDKKNTALECYNEEMRKFPHSRSIEAVEALAKYRGATVGVGLAEAFFVSRMLK
jgi:LmbE family N-acetylglucosaminyl deacetylase